MTDDDRTIADAPNARDDRRIDAPVAAERFRVVEKLGQGGMGEVIAARDNVLGREIAIKRMLEPSPTGRQVKRFLREAKIQGALDHPAIPPVHELAHDAAGRPFFVMKRLIGTSLDEIFAGPRDRKFTRERLLRALAEVCLAVELAHVRGVVHRDLKPSNIMLGDFGEVFVLDWGVAKVVGNFDADLAALRDSTLDEAEDTIGTPASMSPEKRTNVAELDGRSDVFSLGRVLADILEMFPEVEAPELATLVDEATELDRDKRLRTARMLGERVQRYLDGDRDLAQRRDLAAEHLVRARAALATDERIAMQEAGRALALDPTLPGAAELVGRLMLEPPRVIPPEVEASLRAESDRFQMLQSRRGLISYLFYIALFPLLLWFGVTTSALTIWYGLTVAGLVALAWYGTRHPVPTTGLPLRPLLVIAGNAMVIAVFSRLFSPFLIGPGVSCVIVATLIGHSAYRNPKLTPVILVAFIAAIIVPWALEASGVIHRTFMVEGLSITIAPIVVLPAPISVVAMLIGYSVGIIALTTAMSLGRTRGEDAARQRLHIQTWRLQQLLPS